MGKQRRKPHQSFKPRESWNLQSPKKKAPSQGPSQKGFRNQVQMPVPKTREEALQRAISMLVWGALAGEGSPENLRGMVIGLFLAEFDKPNEQ